MLAQIIGGFVVILVGVMMFPQIKEAVEQVSMNMTTSGNLTGGSTNVTMDLLDMFPLFFAIGVAVAAIGIALSALKGFGGDLFGGNDSDDDEDFEEDEEEDSEDFEDEETEDDDNSFKTNEDFHRAKSESKPEPKIPKSKMTEKDFIKSEFD